MKIIKKIREQRGLSQRELAVRAGMSFRGIQQVESARHNWRVSSVRGVAEALGLPEGGLDYHLNRLFSLPLDSVEDISLRMLHDGFDSWKTHLFDFVDRFRSTRDAALIERPPVPELDDRLRALIASTVESLCNEYRLNEPHWCRGEPRLPQPWFVAGIENLKAMALVESPAVFRARGIFVLENFLSRA